MWKQIINFDINKMGTKLGYCLANVRAGFGIGPKYASAKDDMLANKEAETLHDISTIPNNVAVPVYIDSTSIYEHIIVCDSGNYYSDGRKLTSIDGLKVFGWGETCNGVRIVEQISDEVKDYKIIPQKATFTCRVNGLRVRRSPSLSGEVVAYYDMGRTFKYDGYVDNEGIRWVTYIGKSGKRCFVARRTLDNKLIYGDCR